jgi:3-oxoacyl-[acyl-carrier protein] reductase
MLIEGKNAVISGCNRGIGKAILEKFAFNGANIFAVVRKSNDDFEEYVSGLRKKANVNIDILEADFSDEESVKSCAKDILSKKVRIDIIVNNVGTSYTQTPFMMTKLSAMKETFQVNYFSHIYLTQLLSKNMMKNKSGSVIFISSAAAFDGGANVEYVSSKAAMVGATKRLAMELGKFNVRVNAVAPGLTDTDLVKDLSTEDEGIALNMTIMGRKGRPEEIADSVLFLGSDMSSFITGQTLHVDGGIR